MSHRIAALTPRILTMLRAGQNAVHVAATVRCAHSTVYAMARWHGIPLRNRGRPLGRWRSAEAFRQYLKAAHGRGADKRLVRMCSTKTLEEVAAAFGWRTRQAASLAHKLLTNGAPKPWSGPPKQRKPAQ